jgi:hypothetical protein
MPNHSMWNDAPRRALLAVWALCAVLPLPALAQAHYPDARLLRSRGVRPERLAFRVAA